MNHWKTTLGGAVQCVGWILLGIALWADLSGQPKSLALAHCGLAGAIVIGFGVLWHAWHAADKNRLSVILFFAGLAVAVNTNAQFTLTTNADNEVTAGIVLPDKTWNVTITNSDAAQRTLIIYLRNELSTKANQLPRDLVYVPAAGSLMSTNYSIAISNYYTAITNVDAALGITNNP